MNCDLQLRGVVTHLQIYSWPRLAFLAPPGRAAWVRSPLTPNAQNVPSFRRWRFELSLIPLAITVIR